MYELRNYIIKNISSLFISFYMPIFIIASIAILIELAKFTAVIHLTVSDMAKMYLFLIPEILFYTLPVIFFVAVTLALFRLSNDNETIVMFSLGISPNFLAKTIAKPAFLLLMLLIFDFFIVLPHATVMYRNFKEQKIQDTKFNLSASEFGHSFGDWLLYIGKNNKDGSYGDIFLFNKKQEEEILINAKKAKLNTHNNVLTMQLYQGDGYSYSPKKFSQMEFSTMFINNNLKNDDYFRYETPLEYWTSEYRRKNKEKKIVYGVMFSLFPLMAIFISLAISIVHSRHQKSKIYLFIFLVILTYFVSTIALQKKISFYTIPSVLIPWLIATFWIYKQKILARF